MTDLRNSELTEDEIILAGLYPNGNEEDLTVDGKWGMRGRVRQINTARIGRKTSASKFRRQALERVHKMSESVQKKLITGNAQISDMVYYAQVALSGKSADLISESINRTLGITNLDGGKIDKDKEFILSALQFHYDATSATGAFADALPPEVYNGEWELSLDGRKVFDNMPMSVFATGIAGYSTDKPYGYYELNNPKLIKPQSTIELEIKMPASIGGFLKVSLIGTSVKPF